MLVCSICTRTSDITNCIIAETVQNPDDISAQVFLADPNKRMEELFRENIQLKSQLVRAITTENTILTFIVIIRYF